MTMPDERADTAAPERNLALLPQFHITSSWMPWGPIIALFIREDFGVDSLLTLSAILYFGVVVAEVPSGWMSDRVGRVITLKFATLVWIAAYIVLLFSAGSFFLIALGQVLLATGFASISGTDASLHYDTLEALEREQTFEERQARLKTYGYLSVAVSAVVGGAVGLIDLRWAFALSLVFTFWQLVVVMRFTEPPRSDGELELAFTAQLSACAALLRKPILRWIAGYWVAMVVLEHVASTLAQPYITEALGQEPGDLGATPLVTGVIFASFSFVGAIAAAATPRLRAALGFFGVLLAVAALSAVIVTAMALVIAIPVAIFLVFRSVQGALAPIVLTAAVAPEVPQSQRATYLSLHSLAGRISYGSLLLIVGRAAGDSLSDSLTVFSIVSWTLIALITLGWLLTRKQARI